LSRRTAAATAAWLVAALVAGTQCYAALTRPVPDRLADLHVYVASVDLLRHGGSLYDFAAANGAPFTYPPFAGLVFLPLSLVGEPVLRVLWTALTVAAVCWLAGLVARLDVVPLPLPRSLVAPLAAACLFASAPVSSDIRFGQVSVLLALLVVIDLTGRLRWPGILTGLTAAVKLTPLIFVPYLFLATWLRAGFLGPRRTDPDTGRRWAALTATAAFVGATALAWIVLPGESKRYWLTEIWDVNRVGHITTGGNQSLNGALLRLDLPGTVRTVLVGVGALVVGALALWRAVRAARAEHRFAAVTIVGAASAVISPVSWTHHLVWLVLAAFLPLTGPRWRGLTWTVLALVIMVVPVTTLASHLPAPLGALGTDLRLILAIAVACVVPFVGLHRAPESLDPPGGLGGAGSAVGEVRSR
jgi:alpha-1,2-mannosyltransferase